MKLSSFLFSLFYFLSFCDQSHQENDAGCLPTEVMVRVHDYRWSHRCQKTCPENMYVYRAQCYNNCPLTTIPRENGFIKYCADSYQFSCQGSICQKESPYCFNDLCLDFCPEYTVSYEKSCVLKCPPERRYVTAYSCEGVCYSGNNKTCSSECPKSHPYLFSSAYLNHCLERCPPYTAVNGSYCNLNCPVGYPYLYDGKCLSTCPANRPFVSLWKTIFNKILVCTEQCHEGMGVYRNVCVPVCPSGSPYEYHGKCVYKCGDDRPYIKSTQSKKATIYYKQCVKACPTDEKLWKKAKRCVPKCPKTTLLFNNTCVSECPSSFPLNYTKEKHAGDKHQCVKKCPDHTYQYKTYCFDSCPANLKYYLSNCTKECPKVHPFISSDNATCVKSCQNLEVYNGNVCAKICPKNKRYVEQKRCVEFCSDTKGLQRKTVQGIFCLKPPCPANTTRLQGTKQCVDKCPETMLIINGICKNSTFCPDKTYRENTTIGTLCTNNCSSTLYVDGSQCVKQCSSSQVIEGKNCSSNCSSANPYRFINATDEENPVTVCVVHCPTGFVIFQNKCIDLSDCLYGAHPRVVYQGRCYDSCPPPTVLDGLTTCSYAIVELYTSLEVVSFLLAFLFFLSILVICCYKGNLQWKCKKPSPKKELADFTNLLDESHEEVHA